MKTKNGNSLEWLLEYELTQSTRHRRFASVVMLSANGSTKNLDRIFKDVVRDSDPLFFVNGTMAVLMGETDSSSALRAVERYREAIGGTMDVRYSVASFPEDGRVPSDLMGAAQRRMDVANTMDSGSVVAHG